MTNAQSLQPAARRLTRWYLIACFAIFFCTSLLPAQAYWETGVGALGGVLGVQLGVSSQAQDGYDGSGPTPIEPTMVGIFVQLYRSHSSAWGGATGFYAEDFERTPIPAGTSKTWWDFYLWSQNHSPATDEIVVRNGYEILSPPHSVAPPAGYIGHLVIDQVPAGVTWTGPMDYWFDMTINHQSFLMPIAEVSNPLDGTRFHLTVYTPEPSSILALLAGVAGMGGMVLRGRRRLLR